MKSVKKAVVIPFCTGAGRVHIVSTKSEETDRIYNLTLIHVLSDRVNSIEVRLRITLQQEQSLFAGLEIDL